MIRASKPCRWKCSSNFFSDFLPLRLFARPIATLDSDFARTNLLKFLHLRHSPRFFAVEQNDLTAHSLRNGQLSSPTHSITIPSFFILEYQDEQLNSFEQCTSNNSASHAFNNTQNITTFLPSRITLLTWYMFPLSAYIQTFASSGNDFNHFTTSQTRIPLGFVIL